MVASLPPFQVARNDFGLNAVFCAYRRSARRGMVPE